MQQKTAIIGVLWIILGCVLPVFGCEASAKNTDGLDSSDTGTGTGLDTDTDTDTDSDSGTDLDSDTETDTREKVPDWLVHTSDDQLWHIPVETGVATAVCDLIPESGVDLPTFQSITFTRDDRLLVSSSANNSLWEIMLPSCEIYRIGEYSQSNLLIAGIAPDEKNGLFGVSAGTHSLFRIDPDTAVVTLVGAIGKKLGNVGGTWVEEEQKVNVLNSAGDYLYVLEPSSGAAISTTNLDVDFTSVGMEYHPHNGKIYGCTNNYDETWASPPLFEIDAFSGEVKLLAETGLPSTICDNLGAPWGEPPVPPPPG